MDCLSSRLYENLISYPEVPGVLRIAKSSCVKPDLQAPLGTNPRRILQDLLHSPSPARAREAISTCAARVRACRTDRGWGLPRGLRAGCGEAWPPPCASAALSPSSRLHQIASAVNCFARACAYMHVARARTTCTGFPRRGARPW